MRQTWVGLCLLAMGCGGASKPPLTVVTDRAIDAPLRKAAAAQKDRFQDGDAKFDLGFREPDGLGPLYIRNACASCHSEGLNGPGLVQKMVVVEADGVTPAADQSRLPYGHTVRGLMAAGATTPISPPQGMDVKVSRRLGPVVLGRGYVEAVADSEIHRTAELQAVGGELSGRVNRVTYDSEPNPESLFHSHQKGQENLIGRFGFKARIATVDEFTADAMQGDMGLTNPLRPAELKNPDGLMDDRKSGVDTSLQNVNLMADYLRLLEIPKRPENPAGAGLFTQVGCAGCHVSSLRTRADYPIEALADIDAPIYSDLLLHDMGEGLADGLAEGVAGPREWRTTPLIGLSFLSNFLHDGRAKSVQEAIEQHQSPGSEATLTVERYRALSEADRTALNEFVSSL